jgi:hypothetical protein
MITCFSPFSGALQMNEMIESRGEIGGGRSLLGLCPQPGHGPHRDRG